MSVVNFGKAALVIAAMMAAAGAEASLTVQIQNGIDVTNRTASGSTVPISLAHDLSTADGRAYTGFGLVDYGVAKAVTSATGSNFGQISAETSAIWSDVLTITTPGSSSGFVTARMAFDSALSFGTGGFSFNVFDFRFIASQGLVGDLYFYQYNLNTAFSNQLSATLFVNNNGNSSVTTPTSLPDGPILVDFVIPFTSGQAFTIYSSLSCNARGNLTTAICDAGNSAYWGGIQQVMGATGNLISDYSLNAASGTDWNQSFIPATGGVPEAASWAMLIAGFGLVGAMQRRRQRTVVTA